MTINATEIIKNEYTVEDSMFIYVSCKTLDEACKWVKENHDAAHGMVIRQRLTVYAENAVDCDELLKDK